jgi:hypothetical protein
MKTTMDLPDALYKKVKSRAAAQGRTVREVTVELYQRWLKEARDEEPFDRKKWLEEWFALADEISKDLIPGPGAVELVREGRDRLDPKP